MTIHNELDCSGKTTYTIGDMVRTSGDNIYVLKFQSPQAEEPSWINVENPDSVLICSAPYQLIDEIKPEIKSTPPPIGRGVSWKVIVPTILVVALLSYVGYKAIQDVKNMKQ